MIGYGDFRGREAELLLDAHHDTLMAVAVREQIAREGSPR